MKIQESQALKAMKKIFSKTANNLIRLCVYRADADKEASK